MGSVLMSEQRNPYFIRVSSQKAPLWKRAKPILSDLDIELTERCNNNCVHCCINLPADDSIAKNREISTAAAKSILTEAASLGCFTVRFTGGEPLLRDDFEDLYLYARKLGLKVLLFTNATLVTASRAELFSRIPPLEKIEVTVYGMKKPSYEAVTRAPGSFDVAWRGIRLLLDKEIPFVVKSALLPSNSAEVEEFEKWAATIPWMDGPPSYSVFFDLHSRRNEKRNQIIRGLRPTPQDGVEFLARRKERFIKNTKAFCSKFIGPLGDALFSCGAGLGNACVDAHGNLQLCMGLRHPEAVYDLKNGSLKDAMTRFIPYVRELKATHPDYLSRCARCFMKGFCEQCPAKSWTEHGTLDTPVEYLCEITHAQARYLGLIGENEMSWEVMDWKQRIKNLSEEGAGREHQRGASWI
jgi:radical SAM protein with 4Fe4S-binding SPASM domain